MPLTSPRFARNARLQRAARNQPPMRRGESDRTAVAIVQRALVDLGYPMPRSTNPDGSMDGIYGDETVRNVLRLQRDHGLGDDGIVGRDTLHALDGLLPTAGPPIQPAPRSPRPAAEGRPSFAGLWQAYPRIRRPCNGPWANQCAIRMSVTLNGEGTIRVGPATYSEPRCSHGHARGAESLANWLWRHHLRRPRIFTDPAGAKRDLSGSQGIIFFKDCFTRAGQTRRVGDHIDLWRRGETKTYDDPGNVSRQVWFWSLA